MQRRNGAGSNRRPNLFSVLVASGLAEDDSGRDAVRHHDYDSQTVGGQLVGNRAHIRFGPVTKPIWVGYATRQCEGFDTKPRCPSQRPFCNVRYVLTVHRFPVSQFSPPSSHYDSAQPWTDNQRKLEPAIGSPNCERKHRSRTPRRRFGAQP